MTLEFFGGEHISNACAKAAKLATEQNTTVDFTFNDIRVEVVPGEEPKAIEARWHADMEAAAKAYRESDEYKEREAKRKAEYAAACAASMTESAKTEAEMREAKSPWPYTKEQLVEYVESLVNRQHDYGTAAYAMSLAAVAAFNYVAHMLGTTGFQSSCADLDILRRTRHLDGPFMLIKAGDALYPQYDLPGKLAEAMGEWRPWLKEQAEKKLAETEHAHPAVLAHWRTLAGRDYMRGLS